ncbi:hypothetical protein [Mangrovibacter plantisponsor]|uniref:hypothetical protein n=1 Tax=Mangrovibacter plantisponsor TaxID=451513 RepID=UPI0011B56E1A|nr:hypothetical protein [Mangrovibacter plantisponsor]
MVCRIGRFDTEKHQVTALCRVGKWGMLVEFLHQRAYGRKKGRYPDRRKVNQDASMVVGRLMKTGCIWRW